LDTTISKLDINCNKVRLLAPITLNLEELIDKTDFNFLLRLSQKDISRRKAKGLPVSQKSKDYIAGFSEKKEKGKWLKPIRLKKLYWVITKIGNKRVNDPFCFDDYVKLPSGFLQKNLGTRYANQCLIILEQLKVIKPDHFKYQVGIRSRAFKLCEPYLGQKRRVIKGFYFDQKDDGDGFNEEPIERVYGVETPFHQHMLDSLKSVTISPVGFDYLRSLTFDNDSGEIANTRLNAINNKIWQFKIDDYNRVTTNVSTLTSKKTDVNGNKLDLRRFLLLDDEPLVEIDIKSSHPFHCIDLYRQGSGHPEDIAEEKEKYVALFKSDYYNAIRGMCGLDLSRGVIKALWLKEILNRSRPKSKEAKAILAAFEPEFPVLIRCMRKIREINFRQLSHYLMRIESRLLVHTLGREIWEETGAKFLTVYDSIIINGRYAPLVYEKIDSVYRRHLGAVPLTTIKNTLVKTPMRQPEIGYATPVFNVGP